MADLAAIKLTILSAQDILLISDVARRHGYIEDGVGGFPQSNPNIRDQYVFYSAWQSAKPLKERLYDIRSRRMFGSQKFVETIEIVGHAHRDAAGALAGIKMRDEEGQEFCLDESGDSIQGVEILDTLFEFCTPTATLRLICCDGEDLPSKFLAKVLQRLRTGSKARRLFTTTQGVEELDFGLGGFVADELLKEIV